MGPLETTSAAIADVDGDGHDDAIFTNQVAKSATIWWGRTGGMPEASLDVPLGRAYAPIAVGDVNNDGQPDLVAALQDDSAFSIALGMGRRTFAPPTPLFQSPPPTSVAVLDVAGGAAPDILFDELFNNMMVREPSAGAWLPHRKLLGLEPATSMAGVLREPRRTWLLLNERGRMALRALDGTESHMFATLTRWVPGAADAGSAYGLDASGNLVRAGTDGGTCIVGPYTAAWSPAAAGDLDGDHVLDIVALDSCRECTSNHVFLRGVSRSGP